MWHVLSENLSDSTWRAAINKNGIIAACHCIKSEDGTTLTHQQILTNLFEEVVEEISLYLVYYSLI